MNATARLLVIVCLFGIGFAGLRAQDPFPLEGPGAARIEQLKKVQMMDFLKLDEETSIRFFSRYNAFVEQQRDMGRRKNEIIDRLESMVRRNADPSEYTKVIAELSALGPESIRIREDYLAGLSELLPPDKVASYIVFERNFYRRAIQLIRQMARERNRGMQRP